ncbi:MAG: bifunctional demethylmenaquinone methyltransferase/2-methoxy-6-polyprenyl-1,4-benzoquinol methylase UbiE [Epsilonproteobacteria bacterium]|nr:MAG: bifunctional demethylmenaquinone methyltransferase/2-methoxy-6-polyprenyl-1,4-benzoquinol methylase UbiE [Campylobacterota bacterium]
MNKEQNKIVAMFDIIAKRYDISNRVLSMGIDKSWRNKAVRKTYKLYDKDNINHIVDVACGTGDLMIYWQKIANNLNIKLHKITGIDPSSKMIDIAKQKIKDANFTKAFAQNLPIENNTVDIVSIAYGIRNVVNRAEAFSEFYRVLKVEGLLTILEFTKDEKKFWFSSIKKFYMTNIMPLVGKIVSGNSEAYKYLPDSIKQFVTSKQLQGELEKAGFKIVFVQDYSFDMNTTIIAKKV